MNNIIVNEQSSIKIDNYYFDPFHIKEKTHDAKIIFFTHSHYDHFSKEDYEKVMNDDTKFVMPKAMLEDAIKNGINVNKIIAMNPNEKNTIDNITIESIPSYNTNKPMHKKEYNFLGYLVTINNIKYYICGDMDIIEEAKIVKCDYLFIPIGGTYTMDYKEAAKLTNIIKPKYSIPTHYGSIVGTKDLFDKYKELIDIDIETIKMI